MKMADFSIQSKEEIVRTIEEVLGYFWTQLSGVIGIPTTIFVFQSVLRETVQEFLYFENTRISDSGIQLNLTGEPLEKIERNQLNAGLLAFLDNCLGLLHDLTGNILVSKLEPLVNEFRANIE